MILCFTSQIYFMGKGESQSSSVNLFSGVIIQHQHQIYDHIRSLS